MFNFLKKSVKGKKGFIPVDTAVSCGIGLNNAVAGIFSRDYINKPLLMTSNADKYAALQLCTPLSTVLNAIGRMLSNCELYVEDKNGNEKRSFKDIRDLLNKPNPLQTRTTFLSNIEIVLKLYGYCPVFTVRPFESSLPYSMFVIPPSIFHLKSSGKIFRQYELKEIIDSVYLEYNGKVEYLNEEDYFLITDSSFNLPVKGYDITFNAMSENLSRPINNWLSATLADYRLTVNGGPKGILYSDYSDVMNNQPMMPDDKEELELKLKRQYGILNNFPIAVSPFKVGWVPLDYDSDKLRLQENETKCEQMICSAYGINYSMFNDSKYDNQESAKRSAYQDVVIPDSLKISESLSKELCPEGVKIRFDYSSIPCLQNDKSKESETLQRISDSIVKLVGNGLLTKEEARIHLAKYIDINPEELIETQHEEGNE